MKTYLLEDILLLKRDFDLFDYCHKQDQELLQYNIYQPFPLAGKRLVWGFSLLKQARILGIKELNCQELAVTDIGALLRIALKLENRAGFYTWREKEKIYAFLIKHKLTDMLDEILAIIENRMDPHFIDRVQQYKQLSKLQKEFVDKALFSLKIAFKTKKLPALFFKKLKNSRKHYSFSTKRLLAVYVQEIILRDSLHIKEQEKLVNRIFSAKNPLMQVKKYRFPILSKMESEFGELNAKLLKGTGVNLCAPQYFEGSNLRVSFSFNSSQSLQKRIQGLSAINEHRDEFFKFLQ